MKNTFKIAIALLLVLSLSAFMFACAGNDTPDDTVEDTVEDTTDDATTPPASDNKPTGGNSNTKPPENVPEGTDNSGLNPTEDKAYDPNWSETV